MMVSVNTERYRPFRRPLVWSYGLGVDSTAGLMRMVLTGDAPDLILFANTGNEKQETYDYLPVINKWLKEHNAPQVTIVQNTVKNFKHWPPYRSLGENCLTNGTLPSLAFGFKSCSLKWKVTPQNKFCEQWAPAKAAWAAGERVVKCIGYDASPKDMKRYAQAIGVEDQRYDYRYPLIEWGWDRDRCKAEIRAMGLEPPPKSACYFCPATQPEELHEHKAIYLRYIVIMEARAKPRLEGHIPQEELDRQYAVALKKWERKCDEVRRKAAERSQKLGRVVTPKLPKKPRHAKQATGVLGLWRRGRKGNRGGKKMPGMMTDYIREHQLLPLAEIDELIAQAPQMIIDNQQAFENGLEIPEWHDFIEAFTPEDALDEARSPLPLLNPCYGCHCL